MEIDNAMPEEPRSEAELIGWLTATDLPIEAAVNLHLIAVANVVLRAASRLCARHGVTMPQWMALRILWQAGPEGVSLKTLSRCLMLSKAPITGLMDRLEREGLARREPYRTDRRIVKAVITDAGVRRFQQVKPELIEWKDRAYAGITAAERVMLLDLLQRLLLQSLAQPEAGGEPGGAGDGKGEEELP